MTSEEWEDQAACRKMDPDLFFPEGVKELRRRAEELRVTHCGNCPVNEQCLMFALDRMSGSGAVGQHGIWAGTEPAQRRKLAQQREKVMRDGLT